MLETARLIIRKIAATKLDMEALYTILSDKNVNKYLPWYPVSDREEARSFYKTRIEPYYQKENGYYFLVCFKEGKIPIGYVTASGSESHDFGYGLLEEYWGQGLITEACVAIIQFLKAQGWSYITATHDIHNVGSGKVMEKLGMSYKYSYKEQWQPKDLKVTFRMYQLNLDHNQARIFQGYWDNYSEHFIENL